MAVASTEWMDDAACAGMDVSIFYAHEERVALRVAGFCRAKCPVVEDCLTYVLRTERTTTRHGVWGGTTARQRASVARRERRAARKAVAA